MLCIPHSYVFKITDYEYGVRSLKFNIADMSIANHIGKYEDLYLRPFSAAGSALKIPKVAVEYCICWVRNDGCKFSKSLYQVDFLRRKLTIGNDRLTRT